MLRQRGDVEIVGLLTTINQAHERVAMHAVRVVLVQTPIHSGAIVTRDGFVFADLQFVSLRSRNQGLPERRYASAK